MLKKTIIFVALLLLTSCPNPNNKNNNDSKDDNLYKIENDIEKYFPIILKNYEIHYTISQQSLKCPDSSNNGTLTCAFPRLTGYGKDDGYLKISSDNKALSLKLDNKSEKRLNYSPNEIWKTISIYFIKEKLYYLDNKLNFDEKSIIWKVSNSEKPIEIKNHELYPESEKYIVRTIKAKIPNLDKEIEFTISKDKGIIEFYMEKSNLLSQEKMIETKNILIGKFVKRNSNKPISPPPNLIKPVPVTNPPKSVSKSIK